MTFLTLALILAAPADAQQIVLPPMKDLPADTNVQRVDFTDPTDVTATVNGPDLKMSAFRTPATFNSLIKLRSDFVPEVRRSVNKVR